MWYLEHLPIRAWEQITAIAPVHRLTCRRGSPVSVTSCSHLTLLQSVPTTAAASLLHGFFYCSPSAPMSQSIMWCWEFQKFYFWYTHHCQLQHHWSESRGASRLQNVAAQFSSLHFWMHMRESIAHRMRRLLPASEETLQNVRLERS